MKEEDLIQNLYVLSSHSHLLYFTTLGKVYWLKVYEIPVASRTSKGRPLVNMLNLDDDETVIKFYRLKILLKISMSLWQLETVQ